MLLELMQWLESFYHGFHVFHYLTTRILLSILTALFLSLSFGSWVIKLLIEYQVGQPIRELGPSTHMSKVGTPTMGGCLILIVIALTVLLWSDLSNKYIWLTLITMLGYGFIGFIDDYLKLVKKNSSGLRSKWKYLFQSILALTIGFYLYQTIPDENILIVPFIKNWTIFLGPFFIVVAYFTIVGSSNAVNLSDGLDGLAIMCTVLVACVLCVFAYVSGNEKFAHYLLLPYLPGTSELAVFCAAICGAGLGFLWFNAYPAQVFMGDVGALPLGAILGVIAVILKQEILLFIIGGVFVVETLSVILQVLSFKITGNRIFRMAPLHHHFELKGWSEPKVIVRFWIVAFILALIGLASLKIR